MHWGKLISITGGAQVIVQAVGFVCGILIIRLLPVQEYAFYTLANTMLGTMTVLADGGISSGVMSQGGKVWQDKEKLGAILATGLDLRRKFAIGSLLISVPILFYLLIYNNASWITASLITLSLIPTFFAALSDSLLEIAPKLHQSITPLQKNQVMVGVGRLLLSGLFLFIFPWAFLAILATGIPRIYGNLKLKKIASVFIDDNQSPDPLIRKEILTLVQRTMPESMYYCISGQLTVWLISIFGSTASLAHLGALSRFGVVTSLFSILFMTLIVPRFARLPNVKLLLYNKIGYILLGGVILSAFIITMVWFFSNQVLWLLGDQYAGLNKEFILIIVGSCITLIQGFFFSINLSKGWAIKPIPYILISLTTTLLAAIFINLSTLYGIIIFNIIISIIQALVFICYCFFRISRL